MDSNRLANSFRLIPASNRRRTRSDLMKVAFPRLPLPRTKTVIAITGTMSDGLDRTGETNFNGRNPRIPRLKSRDELPSSYLCPQLIVNGVCDAISSELKKQSVQRGLEDSTRRRLEILDDAVSGAGDGFRLSRPKHAMDRLFASGHRWAGGLLKEEL